MKEFFKIKQGYIENCANEIADIIIYSLPDDLEKEEILKTLHIDQYQ